MKRALLLVVVLATGCVSAKVHEAALALQRSVLLEQAATIPRPGLSVAIVESHRAATRATCAELVEVSK